MPPFLPVQTTKNGLRMMSFFDVRQNYMIPNNIKSEHILAALAEIDRNGIPPGRQATKFVLVCEGRKYPPKYVLSLAARHATGTQLLN
jgi:hypothetical protein